ncbi:MAG: cell division FtsA domain-containing protein [Angelakisella sp.]
MEQQYKDNPAQEYLFALDIGTRSVIGIVGYQQDGLFHVLDTERVEHNKRTMFDGQIEDIEQVARVTGLVKERLEQRLGITLSTVCVAAAGRALRTQRASFALELNAETPISTQNIYQLEMGAIGLAQDAVNSSVEGEDDRGLFCVGYSVISYLLDDYRMTTILGHKGKNAKVEVIATFLPTQVVDSLRSAMALIHLSIINLTLEPIAAMNAVIPAELRLLNLALVDIGAGTSDIAVSDQGSVVAYTMATVAGDEITEALMKRYLVDFATAEQLKSAAGRFDDPLYYTDILGFEYILTREELLETMSPAINSLAEEICSRITECNNGAPVAVFLVGGGSKVPLLASAVANRLHIDPKKVAVGGSGYMKKQTTGDIELTDPEYATPLGIALTAASYAERNSMQVFVNDQKVQMLRSTGFTVMNALLMCGYQYSQLMGRSGRGISFRLEGEDVLVRGGLPSPAEITVNDRPASLATGLEPGDRIIIMPSVAGGDAAPKIGDYTQTQQEQTVTLDGIPYGVGELALCNGTPVRRDHILADGDELSIVWINSLGQLCTFVGLMTEGRSFTLNGEPATLTDLLRDGDVLLSEEESYEFQAVTRPRPALQEQGEQPHPAAPNFAHWFEPSAVPAMTITLNQRTVELFQKEDKTPYQFIDMLNLVDIDPTKPEGEIVLRVNGKDASYLQEIHPGDTVQIYWAQRGIE